MPKKGRGQDKRGRSLGPADKFVALRNGMRETPAWRSLSFAARCVYIEMKAGVQPESNGKVKRSSRFLADVVGTTRPTVDRALRELIDLGFIERTQGGCLGSEGKGKPSLWRLTEMGTAYDPTPTKDYHDWQPPKFKSPATQLGHSGNATRPLRAKGGNATRPGWQSSYAAFPHSEGADRHSSVAKSTSRPGGAGKSAPSRPRKSMGGRRAVPDLSPTTTAGLGLCTLLSEAAA